MSDQRVCPVCESPMRTALPLEEGPWVGRSGEAGAVSLEAICTNPNCPSVSSGLAGPASGEAQRIERETGGDDGLAGAH